MAPTKVGTSRLNGLNVIDQILRGQVREAPELGLLHLFLDKDTTSAITCEGAQFVGFLRIEMHPVKSIKVKGLQRKTNCTIMGVSIYAALKLALAHLEVVYDSLPTFAALPVLEQLVPFSIMRDWEPSAFIANAKYCLSWPLAKYLMNDLPAVPPSFAGNPLLFTGRAKQMLKNRLNSQNDKSLRLFAGIQQGVKRGAAVVPDDFIADELRAHRQILTVEPVTDREDLVASERKFSEIFSSYNPPKPELLEASGSASFDAKRDAGGGREYIRQYLASTKPGFINKRDVDDNVIRFLQDDLLIEILTKLNPAFGNLPADITSIIAQYAGTIMHTPEPEPPPSGRFTSHVEGFRIKGGDRTLFDFSERLNISRASELIMMGETKPGETFEFSGLVIPSFKKVLAIAKEEPIDTMVHPITEALKVRLITKGNTFRYWISRFYQKGLWKHLQSFPQFVLTGKVLDPTDLLNMLDREKRAGVSHFDKFVSGDYKAATDRLNIEYTKEAFEASLGKCMDYGDDLKEVLRSVLYEQDLHYPQKYAGTVQTLDEEGNPVLLADEFGVMREVFNTSDLLSVRQKNGQLMGSTLSFPILCIINLVCYWRALEDYLGHAVKLEDLPVLVNGDDILFRCNDEFYLVWRKYISKVGFVLSLGKNFVHKNVLTVNSTYYRYVREPRKGGFYESFKLLGYLNVGLLIGQKKTGGNNNSVKPIWDQHNELVDWAVDPLRASRRFMHYRMNEIKELTRICDNTTANLFLPFEFGGLGFNPPTPSFKFNITSFQRKFAAFVEMKNNERLNEGIDITSNMGLIVKKSRTQNLPKLHHIPNNLALFRATDVLNVNQTKYVEKTFTPPTMTGDFIASNPKDIVVRRPKPRVLEEFRQAKLRRMSTKELMIGSRVVVESREIIPEIESLYGRTM